MLLHCNVNKEIFIIGSGPHAQDLHSWLVSDGHDHVKLVDYIDFDSIPVGSQVVLGFKNTQYRKNFLQSVNQSDYVWPSFVHASAVVTGSIAINPGIIVSPLAVIGHGANIDNFCTIGIMSIVGHKSRVGSNTVINQKTIIGGSTCVGSNVFFGQACSIKDKITICDNTFFAMNSVVSKDITTVGQYNGNRRLR